MQDQNQFQLDLGVFTGILLAIFVIGSAGFLIGILVGNVALPADPVTVLPFLTVAFFILIFGAALTAFVYWSIQVAPQQPPVQALRHMLVTHSIKRSSRMDRRKSN